MLITYCVSLYTCNMHSDSFTSKNEPVQRKNHFHHSATFDSQFYIPREQRVHQRIISKAGNCNIRYYQSKREKIDILQFLKLVDYSWGLTLVLFISTLLISWFGFGVLYWLICYSHGDLEPNHLPHVQKQNNFKPCVYDIYNFASCFMFSIETQHTLGYGVKATTDECPEAIFVNTVQCLVGFVMQGLMAVIIFYKMTLPRHRHKTLLFSRNAVICPRNKKMCLMFRIGDMRKNDIVGAQIRAFFIRTVSTIEGETLINDQNEIKLLSDDCNKDLFFNWPLTIYHIIDKHSPLYYLSPSDLNNNSFEIAIILEGTIESTGQMTQHRMSYMPREILWGRKFEPLLTLNKYTKNYEVDLSKFNDILPVCTPLCSVAYTEEYDRMQNLNNNTVFYNNKNFAWCTSKPNSTSRIKLNFTPRKSIGEIDMKTVVKLTGKVKINICNSRENDSDFNSADEETLSEKLLI